MMATMQQLSPFTDFCFLFLSIILEGAPFILLGTVISGLIDAYLPPGLIDKWLPKNKPVAVMLSGLLGIIFPVCECTIVPVIRRLIKKGLPISCAVTYMLSSPIINPITIISTMNAFSSSVKNFSLRENASTIEAYSATYMTSSRLLVAFAVTVMVGWILLKVRKRDILADSLLDEDEKAESKASKAHDHDHDHKCEGHDHDHKHDDCDGHDHEHADDDHKCDGNHEHDHDHSHSHDHGGDEKPVPAAEPQINRPVLAMRTALRDFVETAMYFTIGVAITSVFKAFVTEDLVMVFNQSEPVGVGLMMVLAFILSLCSTSDAFIAANFPVPQSARLAFLVYGPMMDVKLIFMYLSVFRAKFVAILAVSLFVVIGVMCYVWFQLS